MITGNEPAMPCTTQEWSKAANDNVNVNNEGLTIRQHFTAMAMQGLLANPECLRICKEAGRIETSDEFYASVAVEHADALIAELNKEK